MSNTICHPTEKISVLVITKVFLFLENTADLHKYPRRLKTHIKKGYCLKCSLYFKLKIFKSIGYKPTNFIIFGPESQ